MLGMRIAALVRANGWILNLLFIALGAYFVAGAVNAVIARSVRVVPTAEDTVVTTTAVPALALPRQSFASIAERNLFGVRRESLSPAEVAAEPDLAVGRNYDPGALRPCSLSANVRATLVADDAPEWSIAVVFVNNENGVYSINDGSNRIVDDAVLVDVLDRAIVVRRRDHFERCAADTDGSPSFAPVAMVPPAPVGDAGDMSGVARISETQYTVDRSEVDRSLNNLNEVATQARIVPSFKNGKANGFKLFSIKPGSIYQKIGLQNGDVIQKINGYEMSSPDKALEIYQKLKDATSVTIDLQRRGQNLTMNYVIR